MIKPTEAGYKTKCTHTHACTHTHTCHTHTHIYMFMFIYVCIYIYIYVYDIYVSLYLSIYIYVYVYIYSVYIYIYVCIHVSLYICIIYICVCMYIFCVYIYICITSWNWPTPFGWAESRLHLLFLGGIPTAWCSSMKWKRHIRRCSTCCSNCWMMAASPTHRDERWTAAAWQPAGLNNGSRVKHGRILSVDFWVKKREVTWH